MKNRLLLLIHLGILFSTPALYGQLSSKHVANAAEEIVNPEIIYDPSYFSISYPNGDVPSDRGVCTDVVVRTYRQLGVDLQQRVHQDMKAHFEVYPNRWGLRKPDRNIDHRRVPNLMTFFARKGSVLPNDGDFNPGEIVCWDLGGGILHIGVVSSIRGASGEYMIVHNIGSGQVAEDVLLQFEIIGHYLYLE